MIRKCDNCSIMYKADKRNVNRGWGLCCCKSCAAHKREKSKPGYNPINVIANNLKRAMWMESNDDEDTDKLKAIAKLREEKINKILDES